VQRTRSPTVVATAGTLYRIIGRLAIREGADRRGRSGRQNRVGAGLSPKGCASDERGETSAGAARDLRARACVGRWCTAFIDLKSPPPKGSMGCAARGGGRRSHLRHFRTRQLSKNPIHGAHLHRPVGFFTCVSRVGRGTLRAVQLIDGNYAGGRRKMEEESPFRAGDAAATKLYGADRRGGITNARAGASPPRLVAKAQFRLVETETADRLYRASICGRGTSI